MEEAQRHILLKTAHDAIEAVIKGEPVGKAESDDPELNEHCGCFVTLKNRGRLRGCLGQFTSELSLVELVGQIAKESAVSDPRFAAAPIAVDELDELDIEISVLSPLKLTKNPLSLRCGIDGIYIKKGHYTGCFLPQVAEEAGWDKEQFLSNCCEHKAGLSADAWKDSDTEVYFFTAEVFGLPLRQI